MYNLAVMFLYVDLFLIGIAAMDAIGVFDGKR